MANIKPTRQEALRLKKSIKTASRGHSLLTDKRDGLIRQFLAIIREVIELRKAINDPLLQAIQLFQFAEAKTSPEYLEELGQVSEARVTVAKTMLNIMGVKVPELSYSISGDPFQYGIIQVPKDLDESLLKLQDIFPRLIELAEKEFTARKLAEEIETTRRRVNALEYVIIPEMREDLKFILSSLDELTRQEKVTIMKVKELLDL